MRNAWKVLFDRTLPRFSSTATRIGAPLLQVRSPQLPNPSTFPLFLVQNAVQSPIPRYFSSAPALDPRKDRDHALLAEIFSKPIGSDEITAEVGSLNLSLDQGMVHSVLQSLGESPENARKFFDWVSGREVKENRLLRSKSYNLMLGIIGAKGKPEEFWRLSKVMEEKGYGVSKESFLKVSERFKEEGMEKDLNLLNEFFFRNSPQYAAARRFHKVLVKEEESEVVHSKLGDLGIGLSSDLVVAVLDQMCSHPKKALMFFRWVEENPSFEIDGRVSNAMARVLGREDCINDFWEILHTMRNSGFEIEKETYVKIFNRFYKNKMISAAVELYEFAIGGSEKPSFHNFMFLLKKIVVSKDLDTSLVSKVVRIYTSAGNSIKGSAFDGVLKSLRSVGRLGECDKILKAMEVGGFVADATVYGRVVVGLCDAGKWDEALIYADNLEKSGRNLDLSTWSSLVQKSSLAGQFDKAIACVKKMVERKGGENVGCAFELLVHELCQRKSAEDASKILKDMVSKRKVQPWLGTYKFLIERLLSQGNLKEASSLLEPMKCHGFPPFIDPFIRYVSKSGTANDAMIFLKAMTVDEYPSTTVFLRAFEALLKEGRHQVAHNLLSLSPGGVRNHEDVLDLFYAMKPEEAATAAAL